MNLKDVPSALRVMIVDDEPLARERLHSLLQQMPDAKLVGSASNGEGALAEAERTHPDVILLDIAMPGIDGLEVARRLSAVQSRPSVIFVTAHVEHGATAFEVEAVDYLVKPIRRERLQVALQRARQFIAGRQTTGADGSRTHLVARLRGGMRRIPIEDVSYLQADEKYVMVHHVNGQDLIEDSLKSLEEAFPGRFLRIHRNCLVARRALAELRRDSEGQGWAILDGVDEALEISRRCLPNVREVMEQR